MSRNLASPRTKLRQGRPMAEHDRLPPALRRWLAGAALPWSAASALRLWQKALQDGGCPERALACLSRAEQQSLAAEAPLVWGPGYPRPADRPA